MIDVVFLLLIFFVCTASFEIAEEILPSSLLTTGSEPTDIAVDIPQPLEQVIVRTQWKENRPQWNVNQRPCATLEEVRAVLQAVLEIDAEVPVILDNDGDVPLGDVIDLYDLCRLVGYDSVQLAAKAE